MPAWEQLLRDGEEGAFGAVGAWHDDRLWCNITEQQLVFSMLAVAGVKTVATLARVCDIAGPRSHNPTGRGQPHRYRDKTVVVVRSIIRCGLCGGRADGCGKAARATGGPRRVPSTWLPGVRWGVGAGRAVEQLVRDQVIATLAGPGLAQALRRASGRDAQAWQICE